jgi:predicted NAD/FAD-dependent oxidoreductase
MAPASHAVGIIGAGLSGLMAGQILHDQGVSVTLFEKARRPGGRANTREHGPYRFDHGAQFFTVRDPGIRGHLSRWIDEGIVADWKGSFVRIIDGTVGPAKPSVRYVGVPGMINLASKLAEGLEVRVDTRVKRFSLYDSGWTLYGENEAELGRFDTVLVALPAPQAAELLAHTPEMQALVLQVEMAPCWAGMYVFEEPLALDFDGAFISGGTLSWVARDSSKPGRAGEETWVLHAGPDWTRENLSMDGNEAAMALLRELAAAFGPVPDAVFQRAHRWAFALASETAPHGVFFDGHRGIGVCGDWCMGGRVEGALLSGMVAADQALSHGAGNNSFSP